MPAMIKLGIVGTGGMANNHARNFAKIDGVELVAGCDIDPVRVKDYCLRHGIPGVYTDAKTMLEEVELDAVSVVTSDPYHAPLSLLAIEAGKHVFCEKPLATSHADATAMRDAAQKAGVINMVNFSYRNSAALQYATQLVQEGALGTVRHVHAYYLQSWLAQDGWGYWKVKPNWLWRLSRKHGSKGALGDIGVHILDFASMPLGDIASVRCLLKTFEKEPGGKVGEYALDANDTALVTAEFANGAVGAIHTTRWAYPHANSLRLNLYGDKASVEIDLDRSYDELRINRILGRKAMEWETLKCPPTPTNMERFVESVKTGVNDQPDFARGAAIQEALDACETSHAQDATIRLGGQ